MPSMRGACRSAVSGRLSVAGLTLALFAAICCATAGGAAAHKLGEVEIVSQSGPPPGEIPSNTHYFTTIQAAVEASPKNSWILIEPGVYDEEVRVTRQHSGIWIRGMNRNTVIVDGQHKVPGPQGANGIEIYKANNVYVENLTVRDFDRATPDGPGGNEIWWNGGAESGKVRHHGWWGRYLTAYDDGLDGGYGIFTNNMIEGEWEDIYASGFNDSGIYVGACQECQALITKATMEDNALGYSGSNAGGSLWIEESIFRHNTTGIAPNSENPGDGPPPQDGECNRENIKHPDPTPIISSTEIPRCTIIRHNLITENDNLSAPDNPSSGAAPWGAGVELPGDYADLVEENTITGNPSDGVLAFEYPNPFPPEKDTIYFQNAGNKVADNTFSGNGSLPYSYVGDVAFEGGEFGAESVNNCLSGNSFADATFPADIEGEWGCQNKTTPNPGGGFPFVEYLLELQAESEGRTPVAQPAPPAQPTMPNPCREVPKNPLCP
jgi:hypothetical protein